MTDEICANKPHRLRRAGAMGGNGGQTNPHQSLADRSIVIFRFKNKNRTH